MINLEDYVGQEVVCTTFSGVVFSGKVELELLEGRFFRFSDNWDNIYSRDGSIDTLYGQGSHIKEIRQLVPKLCGLVQKAPNIDLSQFVGKKVLIKTYRGNILIPKNAVVTRSIARHSIYVIGKGEYNQDGISIYDGRHYIQEIYEEGSFQLFTSRTPEPENKKVKELAEQISTLNENELTDLFKIIKSGKS